MAEVNYNEARVEVLKIKNLLRAFEKSEEVLRAAEQAEGLARSLAPEVERLQRDVEEWSRKAADAKAEIDDARRRVAEAQAAIDAVQSDSVALSRRLEADREKAEQEHAAKMAEMERHANEQHGLRLAALERQYDEARAEMEKTLKRLADESDREQKKLDSMRAEVRAMAARAAEMARG